MHPRIGSNIGIVLNYYVAGQCGCVRHDHVVADYAVVCDVGLGHEQTIVADLSQHSTTERAAMDGYKLSNHVAAANSSFRRLRLVLQILRRQPMETNGKTRVPWPIVRAAVDDAVRLQTHVVLQLHFVIDDAIWTNVTACRRCGRVD